MADARARSGQDVGSCLGGIRKTDQIVDPGRAVEHPRKTGCCRDDSLDWAAAVMVAARGTVPALSLAGKEWRVRH